MGILDEMGNGANMARFAQAFFLNTTFGYPAEFCLNQTGIKPSGDLLALFPVSRDDHGRPIFDTDIALKVIEALKEDQDKF